MIYLDNNATTFLDPDVLQSMIAIMQQGIGNASSPHKFGKKAKAILLSAIEQIAHFFCVAPSEIYFSSGATEGLNALIRSIPKGSHVISSCLEHAAVLEPLKKLTDVQISFLNPELGKGSISLNAIENEVRLNTRFIVLSAVNNETGIKSDIEAIAAFALKNEIHLIVDGVALLGKELWTIPKGVSAVCFSGHKVHGPLGVGVCYVKPSFPWAPLIAGGAQQRGMRAGTENLPAIVGIEAALQKIKKDLPTATMHMMQLRNRFEDALLNQLSEIIIHGSKEARICNTSNIAFLGVDGESLLIQLDLAGVAASHGSACSSGSRILSHVLLGMGLSSSVVGSSLRFSLSRFTTQTEIDRAIDVICSLVKKQRSLLRSSIF